jgi:hypothetical protein
MRRFLLSAVLCTIATGTDAERALRAAIRPRK